MTTQTSPMLRLSHYEYKRRRKRLSSLGLNATTQHPQLTGYCVSDGRKINADVLSSYLVPVVLLRVQSWRKQSNLHSCKLRCFHAVLPRCTLAGSSVAPCITVWHNASSVDL